MKAMKFKVHSPEHSEAIQKRLFELGYEWEHGKELYNHSGNMIFTDRHGYISWGKTSWKYICGKEMESTLDDLYNPEFFEADPKHQERDRLIEELKQALNNL